MNLSVSGKWSFADGLTVNPKARPENIGLQLSQFWSLDKWRGHHFAKIPLEVLLTGNLEDIAPTTDFTWWSLLSVEHWTRALRSEGQRSTDQATFAPRQSMEF